jgi:hypothetical protein
MNDNTNRKPIPVEDMDRETLATRLALALGQPCNTTGPAEMVVLTLADVRKIIFEALA